MEINKLWVSYELKVFEEKDEKKYISLTWWQETLQPKAEKILV